MHLLQPVIALLGFAVMAAGYAMPGAYERLYFYYAYRLDYLTSNKPVIAAGCRGGDGGPCGLDEFMKYISKQPVSPDITKDIHPEVEATAKKIFEEEELTGQVTFKKIFQTAKEDYADVFKKVGERFVGKLESTPFDRPPLDKKGNPVAETAEEMAARQAKAVEDVKLCKTRGHDAMFKVFKARVEATIDGMQKLYPDLKIVAPKNNNGVPIFSLKKTAEENPGLSKEKIGADWLDNIKGGHKNNIQVLNDNLSAAEDLGFCRPIVKLARMAKRQGVACPKIELDDEILFPKKAKLGSAAKMAEEISAAEFEKMATQRGLKKIAQEKWKGMSLEGVREKLGYRKLTAESPKISVGKGGGFKAPSATQGVGEVIGVGLWVYGIVEAWRDNLSGLEIGAAATAIFPIIGCAVQAFADHAKGAFETVDTALCLIGDGLMLTGNVPAGMLLHVIRAILSFFRPPPYPKLQEMKTARDSVWHRFIKDDVYAYLYSHPSYTNVTRRHLHTGDFGFADKLEGALAMEALAVLSHGAQSIGNAVASAQDSLQETGVEQAVADVKANLTEATERELVRRQREMLIALPKKLQESHQTSLQPIADEYNRQFTDNITSSQMVEKYHRWHFMGEGAATQDNQEEVERDLNDIANNLLDNPPEMPPYFDLAFVLGQSQGLANIHNETLDVPRYLREKFPTMSPASLHVHVLHHTRQIAERIMRMNDPGEKLSEFFPGADAQGVLELQTLIALKYGRVSDESKMRSARDRYPPGTWSLMLSKEDSINTRTIVNPYVPQCELWVVAQQDRPQCTLDLLGPTALLLTIGLSEALVDSLIPEEATLTARALPAISTAMKEAVQQLSANVATPQKVWSVLVAAQEAKEKAEAEVLALPTGPPQEAPKEEEAQPARRALPRSAAAFRAQLGASF